VVAGVPIAGFTGINGAGKTLLAAHSAICDIAAGRPVYSTVPISSPWGDSIPLQSLRQLLELRDATVLLDEVAVIFSSRTTSSLPPEVVTFLQTVRHRGLTVRWTAPDWGRADILLRGVTQALVNVTPVMKVRDGSLWPRPRLVMAGVLDTSTGKIDETPTKILRRRFAVPRRLASWGAFDTHADTPHLGRVVESGNCPDCGGSRERPKHSEARHAALGLPWFGS
jgi:hypothetical protein